MHEIGTLPILSSAIYTRHHIELRGVVKIYRSAAGDFTALKDVDLAVRPGEFLAIVGKSGSGKTTLINLIAGIDRPSSGEITVYGTAIQSLSENEMAKWRGRNVGIVFQFFQLLPTLTILKNVMLPMDFCKTYFGCERRERAMYLLEQVGLAEHAYKLPSMLSGGEQQRVAIARALANDPPILLADEPTGNIDTHTAGTIFDLFGNQVDRGKTLLVVTHDMSMAKRARRTLKIIDGSIVSETD
jgi:putative ABC transport system ATP-binding protein